MKITVIALDHPTYGLTTHAATSERGALAWLRGQYESEYDEDTDHIADAQLEAFVAQAAGYRTTIEEHDVATPLYPEKPASLQVGIEVPQYLRGMVG